MIMNFKKLIAFVLSLSLTSGTIIRVSHADEDLVDRKVESKILEDVQQSKMFQDNPYMKKILKSVEKIGYQYEDAKSDEEKQKILSDNIAKTEAEMDSCKKLLSNNSIDENEKKEVDKKIIALKYKRDFLVALKSKTGSGSLLKKSIFITCKIPFKLVKVGLKIIAASILIVISPFVLIGYPFLFVAGLFSFCLYA